MITAMDLSRPDGGDVFELREDFNPFDADEYICYLIEHNLVPLVC